ncbi:hypothetical protein BDZ45DRAFT_724213 [Acephala macrosclerotiorum]|nr:hypothetical protein BDZ45DRAFT_724213 [Acephala macrosclerotiorum]
MSAEQIEYLDDSAEKPTTFGTVELIADDELVLIPAPSQDPRDPLNLSAWRRLIIMLCTSLFNTLALTVVSGVGVFGVYLASWGEDVLGLAAGQNEALTLMMIQYGFYAITTFIVFIISFLMVPETKYDRPIAAYEGLSEESTTLEGKPKLVTNLDRITTKSVRGLDTVNFKPRIFVSDLRLVVRKPDWKEAALCYKHMVQLFLFPNIFWVVMMNGVLLGINIAIGTTYGNILLAKPYSWASSSRLGGQAYVERNGGVHEPEFRLIPLIIPTILGIVARVVFGQAGSYPYKFHWFAIIFGYCAQFFSFAGASIVS